MWWWVISPFNDFCGFWSVAVNTMDKLQFLALIIIMWLRLACCFLTTTRCHVLPSLWTTLCYGVGTYRPGLATAVIKSMVKKTHQGAALGGEVWCVRLLRFVKMTHQGAALGGEIWCVRLLRFVNMTHQGAALGGRGLMCTIASFIHSVFFNVRHPQISFYDSTHVRLVALLIQFS